MEKSALDKIFEKIQIPKDGAVMAPKKQHKLIGDILLESNKITTAQLQEALKLQRINGEKIGQLLLDEEIVSRDDLVHALAIQFDLDFYDQLPVTEIDPDLIRNVSRSFCLQNLIVPISRDNSGITVAINDPLNLDPLDDLRIILQGTTIYRVVSPKHVIESALNSIFERQDMSDSSSPGLESDATDAIDGLDNVQDLLDENEEAPVRKEVSLIIRRAVGERASDIHIEPFEDRVVVRFRIDGHLQEVRTVPKKFQSSITTRIKILGKLDIAESRIPQDGRIPLKIGGRECDLRLSTLPVKWGERIVMRILDKSKGIRELDKIGMPEKVYKGFDRLLKQKHGIILVTGPTGSGKTATLASSIMHVNNPDINIITIEDPVEIIIPGVGQVEVHEKAGLTFAAALRSILRQDPDLILVGELRDTETSKIAVQAAITGHLVLTTLHTNDTATSVTRLVDLGIENYQIASSLLGVLAVRLLRTICTHCREAVIHTHEELRSIGIKPEVAEGRKLYKSRINGCPSCKNTGFMGRMGIFELLVIDDTIREYILKNSDGAGLKRVAIEHGLMTLRDSAAERFLAGETSLEEAIHATQLEGEGE